MGFFQAGQKAGLTNVVPIAIQSAFFSTFAPSGRNEKTPLGSNSTRSVSYHHFEWGFSKQGKKAGLTNVVQLRSKRVFFDFPHRGETKKTPLGSNSHEVGFIPPFCPRLFQAQGKMPGMKPNLVSIRSQKGVSSTFAPIGGEKNAF